MAKEDFCFTYYDGDASRDMAHMNRLERGAYSDLIVSQRKFGHLSPAIIKKTLGSDYENVWEAIEIILQKDEEGKYFIEWLDTSIIKMKKQSLHQSINGKKGGRPKANENPNTNPIETQTITHGKPLGNEDGDGNERESKKVGITHQLFNQYKTEFPKYHPEPEKDLTACLQIAYKIGDSLNLTKHQVLNGSGEQVKTRWGEIVKSISGDKWYRKKALSYINDDWQQVIQLFNDSSNATRQNSTPGKSIVFDQA